MALSTRRSGRTRFTILLLVLTAITLLTLDGRGFGPIDSARSAILSVLSPVGDAAAAVFRPIGNAWSSAFDQGDLQAENDRLREENDRLQGEVSAGQVSQEQLQQLLENEGITFTGDIPRAHAQVVAGSVGNFGTTIDLDKGSTSGIAVDMAVVTGKGLIGKVVQVSENRCTVELITSGNYNVGFNVVGTQAVGVARGTESPSVLRGINIDVSVSSNVEPGSIVVTGGTRRSSFPPNLPDRHGGHRRDRRRHPPGHGRDHHVRPHHRPDLRRRGALAAARAMNPVPKTVVRYALLIVTAAVLQKAVFSQLRVDGAVPDALLVLAVAAGVVSGTERGATVGFFSGLALDLMVTTPFGLGAVCYLAAGAMAGALETAMVRSARWLTMVIAALSAVFGVGLFALLGTLLGQSQMLGRHLLVVMAVVAVSTAVLVLPFARACRWADKDADHLRPALR